MDNPGFFDRCFGSLLLILFFFMAAFRGLAGHLTQGESWWYLGIAWVVLVTGFFYLLRENKQEEASL